MSPALVAWLAKLRADAAGASERDLCRILFNEQGGRFVLFKRDIESRASDAELWAYVVEQYRGIDNG